MQENFSKQSDQCQLRETPVSADLLGCLKKIEKDLIQPLWRTKDEINCYKTKAEDLVKDLKLTGWVFASMAFTD